MEFHGKIIEICEQRSGTSPRTGETWVSQDIVVEKDGRYPVRVAFNIFGSDRLNEMRPQLGEFVTVHFDISARCSNGKWFNDVSCYKLERSAKAQQLLNTQADATVLNSLTQDDDLPY